MALPSSGQISLNQIRAELGMSSTSNFSLFKASTSATGYPILNKFSPVLPNTLSFSPYAISEWYGYSSATIYWDNCFFGGVSNLKIYVNGVLRLNDTNPIGTTTSGTLVVNNNDVFYATVTPITYTGLLGTTAIIGTQRLLSPFFSSTLFFPPYSPFTTLNTTFATTPFSPFSSPTQTVSIVPTDLGVYSISVSC
jgi:hypothetical protein